MSSLNDFVHKLQSLANVLPTLSPAEQIEAAKALKTFSACVSAQYLTSASAAHINESPAQKIDHSGFHSNEGVHGEIVPRLALLHPPSVSKDSTDEDMDTNDLYEQLGTGETELEMADTLTCLDDKDAIFASEHLQKQLESVSTSVQECSGWYTGGTVLDEKSPDDMKTGVIRSGTRESDLATEHLGSIKQADTFVGVLESEDAGTSGMCDRYNPGLITVIDERGTLLKVIQPQDALPTSTSDMPTSASDIPTSASDIPTSASDIPTSASDIPTSASDIPTSASDIPTSASDIPKSPSDIPTSASDIQKFVEENDTVCLEGQPRSTLELPGKTPVAANQESRSKTGCLKQYLLNPESDHGKITPKSVTFSSGSPQRQFIPANYPSKLTFLTIPSAVSSKMPNRGKGRPKKKVIGGPLQSGEGQPFRRYADSKLLKTFKEQCTCTVCGKILNNPSNVKVHMRTHSGDRPYVCKYCPQGFTTQANLARHIVSHTGIKQYKCSYCAKDFTEKKSMLSHQRVHTGERPYQCQVCHKMFKHSSSFRAHRLLHFGGKKHMCDTCGKKYLTKGSLQSHCKNKHQIESDVGCDMCQKELFGGEGFEQHSAVHFGKKYICEHCSTQFSCCHSYESHTTVHKPRPVLSTADDEQENNQLGPVHDTGISTGSGGDSIEKLNANASQYMGNSGECSSSADYSEVKRGSSLTEGICKEPAKSYCGAEKHKVELMQSAVTPPKKLCGFSLNILSTKRSKEKTPVILHSGQFVLVKKGTSPSKLKSAGVLG